MEMYICLLNNIQFLQLSFSFDRSWVIKIQYPSTRPLFVLDNQFIFRSSPIPIQIKCFQKIILVEWTDEKKKFYVKFRYFGKLFITTRLNIFYNRILIYSVVFSYFRFREAEQVYCSDAHSYSEVVVEIWSNYSDKNFYATANASPKVVMLRHDKFQVYSSKKAWRTSTGTTQIFHLSIVMNLDTCMWFAESIRRKRVQMISLQQLKSTTNAQMIKIKENKFEILKN